jgi:hypothetical protein
MTFIPTWEIERLTYWIAFALAVLSIDGAAGNKNWDMFGVMAKSGGAIIFITLLGMALLFIWGIFH